MQADIKEFDEVLLTDGRKGVVVEVLGNQEIFEVDIGSSPADWETITVRRSEIQEVLKTITDEWR